MRMLGTCVNVKVAEEVVTKTGLGEHTLDCSPDKLCGPLCENLLGSREPLSTRISGVASVHAVGHLLATEGDLLSVDDDDVVTTVNMRGETGLCLAAEDKNNAGSETTKSEIRCVNDNPLLVYSRFVERYSFVALCVHCLDL